MLSSKIVRDENSLCIEMCENMNSFHNKLCNSTKWFFHIAPFCSLNSIRKSGLNPYGKNKNCCPKKFETLFGENATSILCLYPQDSELQPKSSGWPPYINLAISANNLPKRISLDWSYEWSNLCCRWEQSGSISYADFACRITSKFGSVASYDSIPTNHLLMRGVKSTDDPKTWVPI